MRPVVSFGVFVSCVVRFGLVLVVLVSLFRFAVLLVSLCLVAALLGWFVLQCALFLAALCGRSLCLVLLLLPLLWLPLVWLGLPCACVLPVVPPLVLAGWSLSPVFGSCFCFGVFVPRFSLKSFLRYQEDFAIAMKILRSQTLKKQSGSRLEETHTS